MSKEIVRRRIKALARVIAVQAFFPVLLVILIQMASALLMSVLAGEITARYFPDATVQLGGFAFHYMSPLLAILGNALILPLHLAAAEFLQLLVRGKRPPVSGIFLWFADGEKLSAVFSYFGFRALLTLVTLPLSELPMQYFSRISYEVSADLQRQMEDGASSLSINPALLNWPMLALSAVLLLVNVLLVVRLVAVPYLLADRPKEGAFAAARRSWRLMRGHTVEYIVLILSFFGWILAAAFTFFLAGLYLVPYVQLSVVIFVAYIQSDPLLRSKAPNPSADSSGPPEASV